jgi:RNA polymerase sigma factor (sigma-70 family)
MANGCASAAFRRVAQVFREGTFAGMPDGEILGRFVASRDEAAFELLLRRHGPMVRNVCRQTLFDPHDVEDAFQATFLALVCKAGSLRVEGSLGPWLYRVASRIAARARANRRRRNEREGARESLPEPTSRDDADCGELTRVVHEELARLPERLRAPLVLCYLEGMTHELAARQLRCPVGTVRSRLARARALLQQRMARRGLATSGAALAGALESTARAAALPPQVARSLIQAAAQVASGIAAIRGGIGVSASVAVLLEGVLNVMRVKKIASLAAVLVAVGALGVVIGGSAFPAAGQTPDRSETRPVDEYGRTVGPDGRPIGSRREPMGTPAVAKSDHIIKTYYVGDIIGLRSPAQGAAPDRRSVIDMRPLISLITRTVARGSWKVFDGQGITSVDLRSKDGKVFDGRGNDITTQYVIPGPGRGNVPPLPDGSITPFFLSISLIVRHTPEVHGEVAELLRSLRTLIEAREDPGMVLEEEEERLGGPRRAFPTDPKPVPRRPIHETPLPPSVDRKTIAEIRFEGNATIPADKIWPKLLSRVDQPLDVQKIDADLKSLMHTNWFSSVQVYYDESPPDSGNLILTFWVHEMPVLTHVEFRGRKAIRHKEIEDTTGLKVENRADPITIRLALGNILRLYHEQGYNLAEVKLIEGGRPGDNRVVIQIFEGPRGKSGSAKP